MHHPDKQPHNTDATTKHFALINEAYTTLIDPSARIQYDLELVKNNKNYFQDYSIAYDFQKLQKLLHDLHRHLKQLSSMDIDRKELTNIILYFLEAEAIQTCNQQENQDRYNDFINKLLDLMHFLPYQHFTFVLSKIKDNKVIKEEHMLILNKIHTQKKHNNILQGLKPFVIIACSILICWLIMYIGKR